MHVTGSDLDRAINEAAEAVRRESYVYHETLWRAYIEIGNLIFALVAQGSSDAPTTEAQARRIALTANLVQSTTVVENLVSSGFYWSGAAVLRQHMETLARTITIRTGQPETKTPNVRVLPYRLSKNYGRLSELVHTSGGESLADFTEGRDDPEVATAKPSYRKPWAYALLCLHIAQLVALANEIDLLHREIYPGRELIDAHDSLASIAAALVEVGFWEYLPACGDPT